jgi:hypothetical protein
MLRLPAGRRYPALPNLLQHAALVANEHAKIALPPHRWNLENGQTYPVMKSIKLQFC